MQNVVKFYCKCSKNNVKKKRIVHIVCMLLLIHEDPVMLKVYVDNWIVVCIIISG